MRFKADGHTLGAAGEAAELVEGAFVGRDFWRQPVVLVPDMVIESLRAVLIDEARELFQTHCVPFLGLTDRIVH
ncbi:hypothetical protein D3C75_1355260 [compost metagenome]